MYKICGTYAIKYAFTHRNTHPPYFSLFLHIFSTDDGPPTPHFLLFTTKKIIMKILPTPKVHVINISFISGHACTSLGEYKLNNDLQHVGYLLD